MMMKGLGHLASVLCMDRKWGGLIPSKVAPGETWLELLSQRRSPSFLIVKILATD